MTFCEMYKRNCEECPNRYVCKDSPLKVIRPYEKWTENELRNGIWHLSEGRSIPGGFCNVELLRKELRLRGLSDEGYHNNT